MASNHLSLFYMPHEGEAEATEQPFSDRFNDDRQNIDEEIKDLGKSIRALKSRRNTFSPIARLPPELLSHHARRDVLAEYVSKTHVLSGPSTRMDQGFVHLLSLEGCGTSVPQFVEPEWVDEMLKRSMMASLDIKPDLGYVGRTEAVKSALAHISRIQFVTVRSMGDILKDCQGQLLFFNLFLFLIFHAP